MRAFIADIVMSSPGKNGAYRADFALARFRLDNHRAGDALLVDHLKGCAAVGQLDDGDGDGLTGATVERHLELDVL